MNTTDGESLFAPGKDSGKGSGNEPGKAIHLPELPAMPHGVALLGDKAPCEIDNLTMKVTLGRKMWSHTSGKVPLMVVRWASAYIWERCADYLVSMICLDSGQEWTVVARACRDEKEAVHEAIIASWVMGSGENCHVILVQKREGRSPRDNRPGKRGPRPGGNQSHG